MVASPDLDSLCLGCHWDAFDSSSTRMPMLPPDQWRCDDAKHSGDIGCVADEACCTNDACSFNCSSVCDGFVDCDITSIVCSDTNCEQAHCESTGPACFDRSCFNDGHAINPSITDLFHEANFQWDEASMLMSSGVNQQTQTPTEPHSTSSPHAINQQYNSDAQPLPSQLHDSSHHLHCNQSCHPASNDCMEIWGSDASSHAGICHPDVCDMLGPSSMFAANNNHTIPTPPSDISKLPCFQQTDRELSCSDAGFQHLGCYLRNSGDTGLQQFSKAQSHSHVHRHAHTKSHHRVSHYSRPASRRSTSANLLATPIESPPSLDMNSPSVLTSPITKSFLDDDDTHICRWNHGGSSCGRVFSSAGELQQHLLAEHTNPIVGKKGNGYYCCWEGCHRPHEPFSQKSKLQGHFLTHSNYKSFNCSVCGKAFARQATLERHERSHRGDKPFKCNVCGKSFTDSSELKTHSRTHTGEKPFKCTFPGCSFQTGDSSNMSSHKLTHTGRKHKCTYPGCTKSFTRPDQLKRHLKTTHKSESSPSDPALSLLSPVHTVC